MLIEQPEGTHHPSWTRMAPAALTVLALCQPFAAEAHVKWFSHVVNCGTTPRNPAEVLTSPLFLALLMAAALTLCGVFMIERQLLPRFEAIHQAHAHWKQRFGLVAAWLLRIGLCVYFLSLVSYGDAQRIVLTPELLTTGSWVTFCQLQIAVLVLWKRTVPLAVASMLILFGYGLWTAGWFHMLDYLYFLGVAAFLLIDALYGPKLHYVGFTLLRVSASLSFLWVSIEKWLYPHWTIDILEHELRQITMGLELPFFVTSAGMVEFCLAFLLMMGRLSSQIASLVLLVMMVAAIPLVGLLDAIGHAPLMIVLIIFSASQNRIGYPAAAARKGADLGHVWTFALAVPGLIGLYVLFHALAYPGNQEWMTWPAAFGLVLSAPLVWRLAHTTPHLFPLRRRGWPVHSGLSLSAAG